MIIEFLGLPGSGKSTLHKALGTRLIDEGWSNINVDTLDRIDNRLAHALRQHPIARHSYRISSIQKTYPDFIEAVDGIFDDSPVNKAFLFDALVRYEIAQGAGDKIGLMLIDEGVWHRLMVAAVYNQLERNELFDQIDNFPKPDAVVVMECSMEQSVKNLVSRMGSGRMTQAQVDRKLKDLAANNELIVRNRLAHIRHICEQLENRGVKIIKLKSNSQLSGMVETIHQTLDLAAGHPILVWQYPPAIAR